MIKHKKESLYSLFVKMYNQIKKNTAFNNFVWKSENPTQLINMNDSISYFAIATTYPLTNKMFLAFVGSPARLLDPAGNSYILLKKKGRGQWAVYYTSPKSCYNNVFLFFGLTTLGTFIKFRLVGLLS